MNSVIFEDIARIQAEKKQKRKEMLKLMNENPDWYKHPKSMVYRQIKMLGKDIGEQTMDKSKPINSIDKDKFIIEEYLYLQWVGYSVNAIIEALGMPRNKFWKYKAEHLNQIYEMKVSVHFAGDILHANIRYYCGCIG